MLYCYFEINRLNCFTNLILILRFYFHYIIFILTNLVFWDLYFQLFLNPVTELLFILNCFQYIFYFFIMEKWILFVSHLIKQIEYFFYFQTMHLSLCLASYLKLNLFYIKVHIFKFVLKTLNFFQNKSKNSDYFLEDK